MPENTKNLIRSLRQQLGMTQEEFAHEIAVTVSTVNRWENSHAEPSKLAWKAIRELGKTRGLQVSEALGADRRCRSSAGGNPFQPPVHKL